jgi:hypothetical protein
MDLAAKIHITAPTTGHTPNRPNMMKTIPTIKTTGTGASPPPLTNDKAAEKGFNPAWIRRRRARVLTVAIGAGRLRIILAHRFTAMHNKNSVLDMPRIKF